MNGSGSVGEILRRQRSAHGISIEEIATILRIRPVFLVALEQGRHEQLPGSTYAIGFVRTYADHLGLDGVALVNQFKREAAGIERRTALTFPSPAPDGRVPGAWPLTIAVLAVLLIAGGWYVLRGDFIELPARVAAVPERLAPPPPEPVAALAPETGPESPLAPVPAVPESPAPPPPAAPAQTASPPAPIPAIPAPPSEPPARLVSAAPPALPAPVPAIPAPPPEPPARLLSATPVAPPSAEPSPPVSASALLAAPKPDPVSPTVPPAASTPGEGRVFGAQNENARVVIQARGESWVQVRDASNQTLLTRVLRAGDTYRVPNQPGLSLMTGNAGVLDVFVDGNQAPPLGPVGLVKRNVSLDPERLRAGP